MAILSVLLPILLGALVAATPHRNARILGDKLRVDAVSNGLTHRTTGADLPPLTTIYYFDQLVDHNDPSLGTFKQRYWLNYQYYEPGGPIVLINPGETDAADGDAIAFLLNVTIPGAIAERYNGAVVLLEHRFFGESNPYPDLSVESYRVHTIQQAIDDHEYFATTANLSMPGGDQVAAPGKAPWILIGGSYSGALTSYTMYNKPGLFYAGYASSAVVQAMPEFWQYYEVIRKHMPVNCSADVQAVIAHVDEVLGSGNATQILALKDNFGLTHLTHDDDFAYGLVVPLIDWQALQPPGTTGAFYDFCNTLETKDGEPAGPEGLGLDHALAAWGSYYKGSYLATLCAEGAENVIAEQSPCVGTYNASDTAYTNLTVNNWFRSWVWLTCNELGFWFEGPPKDVPALISRTITPAYSKRQCLNWFPGRFNDTGPDSELIARRTNEKYGGWNTTAERIIFVNGHRDPWVPTTVGADGVLEGTDLQPRLIADGFHGSDLAITNGDIDPSIAAVHKKVFEYLDTWLGEWEPCTE